MAAKNRYLPYFALAAGVIALAFSAIFARMADAPGPVTAFYRIGIATILLAPAFFWKNRFSHPVLKTKLLLYPLLGGLFTALDHAVWNTAVNHTSAGNATLLGNTAPIWVAFAAWLLFHERLKGLFWTGLALALTGAAVVLGTDYLQHPALTLGDTLAIAAGLFYAGYFVVTQHARQSMDTLSYVWLVDLFCSLFLLVTCLVFRFPLTGYPLRSYLAFFALALIPQTIGYLSVGYALGHLPASIVSPTLILQPVGTTLLAMPLLGEFPRPLQWLGSLIVLGGIYLVHYSRESRKTSEPA